MSDPSYALDPPYARFRSASASSGRFNGPLLHHRGLGLFQATADHSSSRFINASRTLSRSSRISASSSPVLTRFGLRPAGPSASSGAECSHLCLVVFVERRSNGFNRHPMPIGLIDQLEEFQPEVLIGRPSSVFAQVGKPLVRLHGPTMSVAGRFRDCLRSRQVRTPPRAPGSRLARHV